MKFSRFTFLAAVLAVSVWPTATLRAESSGAAAYAIVDNTTGYVLESANAQRKLQIGSLTKIATAMVVLDWSEARKADLNQMATVPDSAQALTTTGGVGFHAGDQCSLRDLLYAALMQSDNQAAQTLADHVGKALGAPQDPVTFFVAQMNALAERLGMTRTRFLNPHGLDDQERSLPYSTAEDLAKLTQYAMARSAFRFYVSQTERKIAVASTAGESGGYLLKNTNELLGSEGIDGVKTGTTRRAGQCLIISAARTAESQEKDGVHTITPRRVDVVVLGAADRFAVARTLLERGWRLYDTWAAAGRPMAKGRAR